MLFLGHLNRILALFTTSESSSGSGRARPWPAIAALALVVALAAIWLARELVAKLP